MMTGIEKKMVVLFDEFGTPSLKDSNIHNYFLGISILYELSNECQIFNALDEHAGLSNSKPLKNDKIKKHRANVIASVIADLDVYISANYIDLRNQALRFYLPIYAEFGNISRRLWRNSDKRKDSHILHSQILESCLFEIISTYAEENTNGKYHFEICIDDWSYPKTDTHIILDYSAEMLQKHIQELINQNKKTETETIIDPIKFFSANNKRREGLIDVLTTIVSRSFLNTKNAKYDKKPVEILRQGLGEKFTLQNITSDLIELMHKVIYKGIKETKVKEKPIIIL